MNIKQIECFNALAKTLNFSRAAEQVYVTQSACSRMISSLEDELGCQLFVRDKVKPHLTPAGEAVYQKTQTILTNYEDIINISKDAAEGKYDSFHIGMLSNGRTPNINRILNAFTKDNPHVQLRFSEYPDAELARALSNGVIDAAFLIFTPESYTTDIETRIVEVTENGLFMHKSNPLAEKEELSVADLKDQPFIAWRKDRSLLGYNVMWKSCMEAGFSPRVSVEADSISSLFTYLDCNYGVAIMAQAIQASFQSENVIYKPLKELAPCNIMLAWKKGNCNPLLASLIQCRQ
ncbi:MAG: LysR family transcriptional regulator [Parasporobacterium sp.]|nr:LysR family transcriptional regulator [Parasporobacterium sp.]